MPQDVDPYIGLRHIHVEAGRADGSGVCRDDRGKVGTLFEHESLGGWANRRAWVLV
jgi:hypothetical protein